MKIDISLRVHGREFLRVLATSVIALGVDLGLLLLLTEVLNAHYLIGSGLSFLAGLMTNYQLSVRWAFRTRTVTQPKKEFLLFALIGVIGLGLNQLVLWTLTEQFSFHYLTSKYCAVVLIFFWNYLARKFVLFSPRPS